MTYQGWSNTVFERTSQTTLAHHIKELEENFKRNYALPAQLESAGRFIYNCSGEGFDWPVQYRIHQVEGNTGETQRNFARRNLFKTANLEYRGYQATDAMYMKEFLSNRGEAGIVKVFDSFTERLKTSVNQVLGREFYTDGNAAGNEEFWHGYETLFGTTGTVNISTGAQRATNQADIVAYMSGTYAGLTCDLGTYGGAQYAGAVWPDGDADPEYDFWTPLGVVGDSTSLTGSTWAANAVEALRYAITMCQRNASLEEQMTTITLSRSMYNDLKNLLDDKEEVQVTDENSLRAFGFRNVMIIDGVEVTFDNGVPAGAGYGGSYNNMEVRCMNDSLLVAEGPEYDIHSQAFNAVVSTISNIKFKHIRNCFKVWADNSDIS